MNFGRASFSRLLAPCLFTDGKFTVSGDRDKRTVIIHTSPYCGSVERACLKLSIPVLSVTDCNINHAYTVMSVRNKLLLDRVRVCHCLFTVC